MKADGADAARFQPGLFGMNLGTRFQKRTRYAARPKTWRQESREVLTYCGSASDSLTYRGHFGAKVFLALNLNITRCSKGNGFGDNAFRILQMPEYSNNVQEGFLSTRR